MGAQREFAVHGRYMNLPVENGASLRMMRFIVNGERVREFTIELAEGDPDFWVFSDVSAFEGQTLAIELDGAAAPQGLGATFVSDTIAGAEDLYRERYRPQFHFSSRRGWHNDPNGLVYYRGEYHMFYQHNPYGWKWGNMHWGHAISPDLVHWRELPEALYPDELGTCFSGSGVVDWENTADLSPTGAMALVCIYTSAGEPFTQSLAYSTDRGRGWTKYRHNPVLGHIAGHNRDPKVIWHAPTQAWIMALYLDGESYALFASPDLRRWEKRCDVTLPGASECPDLFELPIEGETGESRWVFWGANGTYLLGSFDGWKFEADGDALHYASGGSSYAAQTWSEAPAGRRIQIAWMRQDLPGMPFNQFMTFPCELTLRHTQEGVRLFSWPVEEIKSIQDKERVWQDWAVRPGQTPLPSVEGELLDTEVEFRPGERGRCGLLVRGIPVIYDTASQVLSCQGRTATMVPVKGVVRLRLLVDRASVEVFANNGRVALPIGVLLDRSERGVSVLAEDEPAWVNSLRVCELDSVWR
jgi:sucrose-6-phosphate hydrolase SacC (GH32 family)